MKKTPNLWSRLGGFAAIHFGLSIFCTIAVYMLVANLVVYNIIPAFAFLYFFLGLLPMILYFPLGLFMGAVAPWARVVTFRDAGASLLLQAGIAWVWGGLVLAMIHLPDDAGWVLAWAFFFAIPLVAPSFLFVLDIAPMLNIAIGTSLAADIALALLAGLLPPLLYNLGNLLMARRRLKKAAATAPEDPNLQEKADSHS